MAVKIYLLSVEELNSGGSADELGRQAFGRMDSYRRQKAEHLKRGSARNLSIGAGLLLQLAAQEIAGRGGIAQRANRRCADEQGNEPEEDGWQRRESIAEEPRQVSQVLACLKKTVEIAYCQGPRGKPDFREIRDSSGVPWHFNLSHSGELVVCAASDVEVGVDIQQMRPLKNLRVAERFFSEKELEVISQAGDSGRQEEAFYRLWVRKEAYGKLTGEGIAAVIGRDLQGLEQEVFWEEYAAAAAYQIALCRYRSGQRTWYGVRQV